jgi:hypothetical protein
MRRRERSVPFDKKENCERKDEKERNQFDKKGVKKRCKKVKKVKDEEIKLKYFLFVVMLTFISKCFCRLP